MTKKIMSILMGFAMLMMIVSSSVFAADVPNFDVSLEKVYANCRGPGNIGLAKVAICEGLPVDIDVKVTNNGNTQDTMNVEVGFYTKEQLEDWGYMSMFSIINSVPNCNPQEIYVKTVSVTLDAGESDIVTVTIKKAPTVSVYKDFYVTTSCYQECWSPETGSTLASWDYARERVYPADITGEIETCTDGIKNQDETGTDCGGEVCKKCGLMNPCISGDDCQSGYCSQGKCETPSEPNLVNCEGIMCDLQRETNLSKPVLYGIGGLIFIVFVFLIVLVAKKRK